MTIIAVEPALQRQERGWDNASLPIAIWEASGSVTGDASGGNKVLQINLQTIGTPQGLAYSLEQLMATDTEDNNQDLGLLVANFAVIGVSWRYQIRLSFGSAASASAITLGTSDRPALFLGLIQQAATTASLSFLLPNVLNAVLSILCRGYIWGPRSVSTLEGGYQRPPAGMFGI